MSEEEINLEELAENLRKRDFQHLVTQLNNEWEISLLNASINPSELECGSNPEFILMLRRKSSLLHLKPTRRNISSKTTSRNNGEDLIISIPKLEKK